MVVSNGTNLAAQVEDLLHNASSADVVRVVASEGLEARELVELPFPGGDSHMEGEHGSELAGRLLIGDGEETGDLSVIDLETGHVHQNELDLGSRPGRIYPTNSGRFAIAVSSDANAVNIVDGGIYLEEHGDHFDMVERSLSTVDLDLTGDRPVHMYVGDEWATVYYDGSGDFVLINRARTGGKGSILLTGQDERRPPSRRCDTPRRRSVRRVASAPGTMPGTPKNTGCPSAPKSGTWTATSSIAPRAAPISTATPATVTSPSSAAPAAC